jgi:hypothetical protein
LELVALEVGGNSQGNKGKAEEKNRVEAIVFTGVELK